MGARQYRDFQKTTSFLEIKSIYRQIGNAVPPPINKLQSVKPYFEGKESSPNA